MNMSSEKEEIERTRSANKEDRVAYMRKVSNFRGLVNRGGWTPDRRVVIRSTGESYQYLSIARIKQLTAPLLTEAGLELSLAYSMPVFEETGRGKLAVVELYATLLDVDTGYGESDVVYGAARADDDKCLTKAQTYALKSWLSCRFLLPEVSDAEEVQQGGAFTPRTDEEKMEAKSKVLTQSALPTKAPEPLPASIRDLPVEEAQKATIARIDRRWRSGEHDTVETEEYERALAGITGSTKAREFIQKYMGLIA